MTHRRRKNCRGCGSTSVGCFLELGPQPLANALPASPDEFSGEKFYPLDVFFCPDCKLVQVLDVIDPAVLFSQYPYVTGTSTSMSAHWEDYATSVVEEYAPASGDLVVEIACNDGSLLEQFKVRDVRTLGVEPATNIATLARDRGLEVLESFFDSDSAQAIESSHGSARVVVANNVLAHVDEPHDFLSGMGKLAGRDGVVIVEVPYLGAFLDGLEYDTIYHEHLCYFSISSLAPLYEKAGLSILRVEDVPVHGGSIRIHARAREAVASHAPEVLDRCAGEVESGLCEEESYRDFATRARENSAALGVLLQKIRSDGATIAAYGAPAKGNTLLNFCKIGGDLVSWTVDKNPLKVGRYLPGTHIPILPVETLRERHPDYVLILPWNLADEIMGQEKGYRSSGGKFIIPIPEPRIV